MKHKKYLRKQVEGEDSENISDDKEDDDNSSINLKYIKKEDLRVGDDRDEVESPRQIGKKFSKLRTGWVGGGILNHHSSYYIFSHFLVLEKKWLLTFQSSVP